MTRFARALWTTLREADTWRGRVGACLLAPILWWVVVAVRDAAAAE